MCSERLVFYMISRVKYAARAGRPTGKGCAGTIGSCSSPHLHAPRQRSGTGYARIGRKKRNLSHTHTHTDVVGCKTTAILERACLCVLIYVCACVCVCVWYTVGKIIIICIICYYVSCDKHAICIRTLLLRAYAYTYAYGRVYTSGAPESGVWGGGARRSGITEKMC